MERVQLERRAAGRARPPRDSILGLSTQEVRLTNGHYSVSLTAVGGGVSECRGFDVSRWTPDATCDSDGFHLFLRDLDDESVWSAGYQPSFNSPARRQRSSAWTTASNVGSRSASPLTMTSSCGVAGW